MQFNDIRRPYSVIPFVLHSFGEKMVVVGVNFLPSFLGKMHHRLGTRAHSSRDFKDGDRHEKERLLRTCSAFQSGVGRIF